MRGWRAGDGCFHSSKLSIAPLPLPPPCRENTPEELHQLRMHKDMCDRLQKANEAAAMAAAMRMYY